MLLMLMYGLYLDNEREQVRRLPTRCVSIVCIYIYKCTVVLGLEKPMPVVAATTVDLSSFHLSHSYSSFYLWHSRLGHVSSSRLRFLTPIGALGNLQPCDISDCSGYKLVKFFSFPFDRSIYVSSFPFDLIHSDI